MGKRVNQAIETLREAVLWEASAQDEATETLAETLKAARVEQKLSLQDVASAANMSKAHIWDIEQGCSTNPTVAALSSISAAIGVPYRKLAASALLSHLKAKEKTNASA